ncbi:MAG: hypothetical protein ACRCZW_03090 [Lactobacillaceae bacterium]
MWVDLPDNQKQHYQKLITNFASLSEAFAQKSTESDIVAPIINSKFQESAFQVSFNATIEDIANTSFDASIDLKSNDSHVKYLVGIKTFGVGSGLQKIAQFKSISANQWNELLDKISKNAEKCSSLKELNEVNKPLYWQMVMNIANARNARIKSSIGNLKGFQMDNVPVESVYHFLMPSKKNKEPKIFVGETTYSQIDIKNISSVECKRLSNPTNIDFDDGIHHYHYTSADSQLLMSFNNEKNTIDEWPVHYIADAFSFFENMNSIVKKQKSNIIESHCWYIEVKEFSGFNAFNGQSKLTRQNNNRERWIKRISDYVDGRISRKKQAELINLLKMLLLHEWKKDNKEEMLKYRKKLLTLLDGLDVDIMDKVKNVVLRPANEIEIRIPKSYKFHTKFPKFFVNVDNIFKPNGGKRHPLISDKKARSFKLKFLPSNDTIDAYINQDSGKSIESTKSQGILGEWVLRDVFQLEEYEVLTQEKLEELSINGIRFSKTKDNIELEFIWIDPENEPKDIWK